MPQNDNNIQLVERAVSDIVNGAQTFRAQELFADTYVWHPGDGVSPDMDRQRHMADYNQLREAFPDLSLKIDDMVSSGDRVATRFTMTGTQQGPLRKASGNIIAPTDKTITWTGITIHRIQDGKIAEGWINYDRAGIDEQLGWRA
jgi:predicted ester cyclase